MERFKALWEYQKADAELTKFENQMKSTQTRGRLLALQKYMQDNQNAIKNIEKDTLVIQNELSEILAQHKAIDKQNSDCENEFNDITEEDDLTYIKDLIQQLETNYDSSNKYKRRLKVIRSNIDKSNEDIIKIVKNMQKAKKQFDLLKVEYDSEITHGTEELKQHKQELEEISKTVDADLLKLYKRLKKNHLNPVALIEEKRCTGCNMELPSGDLVAQSSGKILQCENCGRVLITE